MDEVKQKLLKKTKEIERVPGSGTGLSKPADHSAVGERPVTLTVKDLLCPFEGIKWPKGEQDQQAQYPLTDKEKEFERSLWTESAEQQLLRLADVHSGKERMLLQDEGRRLVATKKCKHAKEGCQYTTDSAWCLKKHQQFFCPFLTASDVEASRKMKQDGLK